MLGSAAVRFEVVTDPLEFASYRGQWTTWARRPSISPFGGPAFFDAWCQAFASDRTGFLIVGRRAGAVEFILPMWHPRGRLEEWGSLGGFRADYTEAVSASDDLALGAAFWPWLERLAPCRTAKIARFPGDSLLGRTVPMETLEARGRARHAIRNLVRARSVRYLATEQQYEHPYADQGHVVELAERIDAKYMRRNIKMLGKMPGNMPGKPGGDVSYQLLHGAKEIVPLLSTFFDMHVSNFAGTGRTSQFESAQDRAFYRALVEHPELADTVCLDVLFLGSRPVAMHLGFQHAGRIYYYKPAFDLEYGKAGPGKILLAHIFARANQEHVQRVDLLKGTEPYKQEWSNHSRLTITSTLLERRVGDVLRGIASRWRGRPR